MGVYPPRPERNAIACLARLRRRGRWVTSPFPNHGARTGWITGSPRGSFLLDRAVGLAAAGFEPAKSQEVRGYNGINLLLSDDADGDYASRR
jgi:hypothetical protein